MTKKTITIIASLAAVILLIGGYFGAQAWIKAHPKAPAWDYSDFPESPRLTSFDSSKLNRIENILEGFTLLRNDGIWELVSANTSVDKIKINQVAIGNKLWSMSNVWGEGLIEENPADLSIYGLDNPSAKIILGDSEGRTVEIIFGNYTPSRTSFYVMLAGESKVYTLSTYTADVLAFSLDSVRGKDIFAYLDSSAVTHFILEPRLDDNPSGKIIDISAKTDETVFISSFCTYVMNAPYTKKVGVAADKFGEILESMMSLEVAQYVDDEPASLVPYGLDRPGRVYIETPYETLDILYGKNEYGLYYAKLADDSSVFTLYGLGDIVNTTPFTLLDKFALIHFIDNVDSFTVSGDGRTLTGTIQGKGDEAIFHLDGRKAADKEFRTLYQYVIGLLIDTEFSGQISRGEGSDFVIEYKLNTPAGVTTSIRLIPYNRDFYLLEREGVTEFRIARTQVRRIFEAADSMVYE